MLKPIYTPFTKPFLIFFSFLLIIGISFWIMSYNPRPSITPSPLPTTTEENKELTTEGTMTCLPHKNTGGPTTLECAYGIQTASGDYYALDNALYPGTIGSIPITAKVRVTGRITPVQELEKTRLNVYDIKGAIVVADIEEQ